jgi:hypothetical protein
VLAAPKAGVDPNAKPPAGFAPGGGVLKLNPPPVEAPNAPAAGAAVAPKGLLELGVPNAGAEGAPNAPVDPKAGVLLEPPNRPPPVFGAAPKAVLPNAGVEAAVFVCVCVGGGGAGGRGGLAVSQFV